MIKKKLIKLIVIVAIFPISPFVFAETIKLKSGKIIEGKILNKTSKFIKIDFSGVPLTYYLDEIESIGGEKTKITSNPAVVLEEKNGAQIFKEFSPAVVHISADGSQGSGFIINKNGTIVTNWHVIGSPNHITVTLKDGTKYECTIIMNFDVLKDICILKIDGSDGLSSIPLETFENIAIGETAYVIGNPLGLTYRISDGIVAQKEKNSLDGGTIQFTCPISPGSSGGPLLNSKGQAIGIVKSSLTDPFAQNLNFAVSSDEIKILLKEDRHLKLAEYTEATKGTSVINQGYKLAAEGNYEKAYLLYKNTFQKSCVNTALDNQDCMRLFLEMLRISCQATIYYGDKYFREFQMILDEGMEKRPVPHERIQKADTMQELLLKWADENIALIEAFGGLQKVLEIVLKVQPSSHDKLNELKEMLCVGYFNAAALSAYEPDGKERFYYYVNIVNRAFPESNMTKKMLLQESSGKYFWNEK